MSFQLPADRMPEAEVALRLAFHLLSLPKSDGRVQVGLDGAHVAVGDARTFPLEPFLEELGWSIVRRAGKNAWQGVYNRGPHELEVHAKSGCGDVVGRVGGRLVRAECKKGPLVKKDGSPEYPLLREALGQLLTIETVSPDDLLVAAIPATKAFKTLASKWSARPLIVRAGLAIVTVDRDGTVEGFPVDAFDGPRPQAAADSLPSG